MRANARLIASAPDLLAALEAIYEWYDRDGSVGGAHGVFETHRLAIARARGADSTNEEVA
jgi:hypothetical protein